LLLSGKTYIVIRVATVIDNHPRTGQRRIPIWEHRWGAWIDRHPGAIASLILLVGFVSRIRAASGTFLNADEAQHFLVANRPSLALAYKSSLTLAHPPLLIIVLYFWRNLGTSEFVLRMLSVLVGTLFCWVFFKWVSRILGQQVGLTALIFVSLLPPLVSLSAQIRQYSLLLVFASSTLYFLDQSLSENSVQGMVLCCISMYLALLSHFSAVFFAAAVGVYALLQILTRHPRAKIIWTWALGQVGALGVFVFLYRTQISKLKGSSMNAEATEGWLRRSYFHRGDDHVLLFVGGRAFAVFQFIFGHLAIGDLMGVVFILAIVWLIRDNTKILPGETRPASRQIAVLFTLPYVLNCSAALVGAYPFGGTRHSVFLAIFALAGIGFALVRMFKRRTARILLMAFLTAFLCSASGKSHEPSMSPSDQSSAHMKDSIGFIEKHVRVTDPIFLDVQSRFILGYYLCPDQQDLAESPHQDFDLLNCGGRRFITANLWKFAPEAFLGYWNRMLSSYRLPPGQNVWVIQEGWSVGTGAKLKLASPQYQNLKIESFGHNIQIFELTVGQSQEASVPTPAESLRPE
jgi:hypothetical protein